MNPVRSIKNQYPGINAHLHSFWQGEHKWNRFHNAYMTHVMEALKLQLRPLGYTAEIEDSLQIRRIGDDLPRRPKADLMVYDPDPLRPFTAAHAGNAAELTVADWIDEEDVEHPYSAIAIYELSSDPRHGEAVAWVELLSPTNKGDTVDANAYLGKRRLLLDQRLVFVEVDYLHETPPTFPRLLDYSGHERERPNAHPYRIAVLDPRPDVRTGPGKVEEFVVDAPIPNIIIPLNAGESIEFDFGVPYQKLFEQAFYGDEADYTRLPLNFDRYSQADRARILARMLSVVKAGRAGLNLEDGSFPVEPVTVEEGLAQLQTLTT